MEVEDRYKVKSYRDMFGYIVFTELAHIERGSCCGNGCLHCPYTKPPTKGNTELTKETKQYLNDTSRSNK